MKIPVSVAHLILPEEEDTLAIFKWRLQQMATTNRWYPVLLRYISYLSGRVKGLGGNPDEIPPSVTGAPHRKEHPCEGLIEHTGKVKEVIFDCFGDVEGFVLYDCCESHTIRTCEREVGELALKACKDRFVVTVFLDSAHRKIRKVLVRC